MTEKDNIKDLFAKGLQDHQVQVDPALWSSISSSLGTGAAKTGLGLLAKTLIGVAATTIVAGAVYLSVSTQKNSPKKTIEKAAKASGVSNEVKVKTDSKQIEQPIQQAPASTFAPAVIPANLNVESLASQGQQRQSTPEQAQTAPTSPTSSASIPHSIPVNTPTRAQAASNSAAATPNATQAQTPQIKPQVRISLPNIFTPNGDGQNETLQLDWGSYAIQDFSIVVLDTKNNVVFKSDRSDFNWDGTDLGGEKLPRAHYIYFVSALLDGQKWQQSSSLQIQY